MKPKPSIRPKTIYVLVVFALLVTGLYFESWIWLVRRDWSRIDFNYAYLIPLICAYLAWEKRSALARLASTPAWGGLGILAAGLLMFWIGELSGEFFTLYISFWLVLVGWCWAWMGRRKLHLVLFPLLLLLSMFPPPTFIYNALSFKLKLLSSQLGVLALQSFGMSAYREGNIIDLGFTQLQVVDACNGLRYLIPLIVLAILVAYFSVGALWKKIVLVLSAIPISLLVNSLRIASVGVLYPYFGREAAEGFFHDFSGWLIFLLSLGILLSEKWLLHRLIPERESKGNTDGSETAEGQILELRGEEKEPGEAKKARAAKDSPRPVQMAVQFLTPPQISVALALLAVTLGLAQAIDFKEKININKSFAHFPTRIEQWSGRLQSLDPPIIAELDLSDYIIADYVDPDGKMIGFYAAYYASQHKGASIHSPETCLPGGGWELKQTGLTEIDLDGKSVPLPVQRATIENGAARQMVYYWFPCRGRILTSAFELKLYTFWDALTRQRSDGALVRLITPLYPGEAASSAEARLQGFARAVVPVLDQFLPN